MPITSDIVALTLLALAYLALGVSLVAALYAGEIAYDRRIALAHACAAVDAEYAAAELEIDALVRASLAGMPHSFCALVSVGWLESESEARAPLSGRPLQGCAGENVQAAQGAPVPSAEATVHVDAPTATVQADRTEATTVRMSTSTLVPMPLAVAAPVPSVPSVPSASAVDDGVSSVPSALVPPAIPTVVSAWGRLASKTGRGRRVLHLAPAPRRIARKRAISREARQASGFEPSVQRDAWDRPARARISAADLAWLRAERTERATG